MYQGIPLNLNDGRYSVHDCASVLKGFLAELPEPLLSDLHYPAHCQIAGKRLTKSYLIFLLLWFILRSTFIDFRVM